MAPRLVVGSVNTILYCANWRETVDFYLRSLGLSVTHSTDWFVEFELSNGARLSVADETRSRIKSVRGQGITLSWQVANADETWDWLQAHALSICSIRKGIDWSSGHRNSRRPELFRGDGRRSKGRA
jgi:catechol 2,3-dioxygenase-like lactoylglutathione lyase family enzyme